MNKTKVALVTGAGKGIGFEFCKQLSEDGWKVILTARYPKKGLAAQKVLQAKGADIDFHPLDVSDEEQIAETAEFIKSKFGALDLLINNAGINSGIQWQNSTYKENFMLDRLNPEKLLEMVRVNSIGAILMIKHFADILEKSPKARVINISSWLGSVSQKKSGGNYGYCMSKAALNMLTRTAAHDLKDRGITIVAVNPGWVQTDMGGEHAHLTAEESVRSMLSLLRTITPEDTGRFYNYDETEIPW